MLDPAPFVGGGDAEHRLRPKDPADKVIGADKSRGDHQDAPIAIRRQEGERTEDVKMSFQSAAAHLHEQRGEHHLSDGDGVASDRVARSSPRQPDGQRRQDAADPEGEPDVGMKTRRPARPGPRRNAEGHHDGANPLNDHQHGEHPIDAPVNMPLALMEYFVRACL